MCHMRDEEGKFHVYKIVLSSLSLFFQNFQSCQCIVFLNFMDCLNVEGNWQERIVHLFILDQVMQN
jgi:hypothetical protein